jgi:hypothetical protein
MRQDSGQNEVSAAGGAVKAGFLGRWPAEPNIGAINMYGALRRSAAIATASEVQFKMKHVVDAVTSVNQNHMVADDHVTIAWRRRTQTSH